MWRIFLSVANGLLLGALNCGQAFADNAAGIAAYQRGDYARAFAEFSVAASKDDPFSQNVLGTMYAQGHGVERNYKLAMDWFYKAQALGLPEAMTNLAKLYELGMGVPQNNAAALRYYRDAASTGFQPAIARLVEVYAKGELGVRPDMKTALEWRDRLPGQSGARTMSFPPAKSAASARKASPGKTVSAAARSEAAVHARFEKGALLEKQLLHRLERHSERKLFVASTDTTPSLAAYLKAFRVRLKEKLATVFTSVQPDTSLIVTLEIGKDGTIKAVEVSRPSGNPNIDRSVRSDLKKLAQQPPLPAEIAGSADVLVVSVRLPID